MRAFIILICMVCLVSCKTTTKLSVPVLFKEQATEIHVAGSRTNKMTLGTYSTSKIKRGMHVIYPGWNRGYFLENLFLSQVGLLKQENVKKEKDNFRFSITDGNAVAQVFGKERKLTKELQYKLGAGKGILESYTRLQEYRYVFSALISTDTLPGTKNWELLMTNIYERKKDTVNKLITIIRPDDNGLATNGKDTIFIKPVSIRETESAKGKQGKLFIKLLSGYELSTSDGVIAIIDLIGSNVWYYNELDSGERLTISAIASAIFARRVNNTSW